MSTLAPDEREKLERHLDEINAQVVNLKLDPSVSLEERARLRVRLTRDWLET